jgi:hypothetical protein
LQQSIGITTGKSWLTPHTKRFRKTKWFDENDDEDINTGAFGDDEVEGQKFDNGDVGRGPMH